MMVLAVVTQANDIGPVVSLAAEFAHASDARLTVICSAYSPPLTDESTVEATTSQQADALIAQTHRFIAARLREETTETCNLPADRIEITRIIGPDASSAALAWSKQHNPSLIIATHDDPSGETGTSYPTSPLLNESPTNTIVLLRPQVLPERATDIFALATDSFHDTTCFSLAAQLVEHNGARLTVARVEEGGDEATQIGMKDLRHVMRDVGMKRNERIRRRVYEEQDSEDLYELADQHDLVLLAVNQQQEVQQLLGATTRPTVGVVKQRPPLQRRRVGERWAFQLNPSDYADLIQRLRRGSRISIEYFVMVSAAAAIATLGLLQDSPAVVIGAMLVAPLMTPIIGCGLALAHANSTIFRSAGIAIFYGFLNTLAVSMLLAWLVPGKEMTAQVLSRGDPDLLDLLIALSSSIAAAYALARPSLVGAIAGVAIATALVPPLSCIGISLAYRDYTNAHGASLLFITNMVAIVLGAACTFRILGVTQSRTESPSGPWVYRMIAVLGFAVLLLLYPLGQSLERTIDLGKPQPRSFPLSKQLDDAIHRYVEKDPEVHIIATGRPGSPHDKADVLIILSSATPLPRSYADKLKKLVRQQLDDLTAVVAVHCLQESWLDTKATGDVPAPK